MALPQTPDQWLDVLAERMDQRAPRIAKLRRYANGNADLPEMGENTRASWQAFQKKARTDYGGLAVGSLCNREKPNGLRIGESEDHPALRTARRIWRDNRLDVQIADAIRDAQETSVGYVLVGVDDDGRAVMTRERPEFAIADPDPLRPWRARAFLKAWRDTTDGLDYAVVIMPGMRQTFLRKSLSDHGQAWFTVRNGWTPAGAPETFAGSVPVAILERQGGLGLIEPHLDVIDRINSGKLWRLTTTAMQAFRQRALKPKDASTGGLPDKDADGNDIDWAKALEPAPGALWDLPIPIDIWESQPTDIRPMLEGEVRDARDFAAATGTPVSVLIPDGAQETAAGAAQVPMQQVMQVRADQDRFGPALEVALVYALRAEGVDLGEDTLEVLWQPAEYVTMTEKFAAAVQAKGAGMAGRTIKRDILGMTPDQIRQDEADLASDQLALALLTMGGTGGAEPVPA